MRRWTALALALAAAGCAMDGGTEAGGGAAASVAADPWAGSGFSVLEWEGRWWIFLERSKDLDEYRKSLRFPEKSVTRIGAGPGGETLKAPDAETLDAFAAWKPGFCIRAEKGRIWVFKEGSKEIAEYDKAGELAKQVTRIGAGPNGATLKSCDFETLDAWAAKK